MNALHQLSEVLKAPQVLMLRLLTADGSGATPADIATSTGLAKSVISMASDKLVARNLVERRFHVRDRRSVNLYLTDQGRAETESLLAIFTNYSDDVKKRQGRVHP